MESSPATARAEWQCTGAELLHWRRGLLRQGGSASELDWLIELKAGLSWQELQRLQLSPDRSVALQAPLEALAGLWSRHQEKHEPLQYLVGRCPWRDLEIHVAPGVLIPRQETELLVDLACEKQLLASGGSGGRAPKLWADLGTGSGCLAIALARIWPNSKGLAVDQSTAALEQAAANLDRHQLTKQVELRHGSWWEPLEEHWGHLELVVSNPPYIPTAVWEKLGAVVKEHEPGLALNGGENGLDAIHAIAAGALQALAPGGWLLLEHHHDQSEAVLQRLAAEGLCAAQARHDLEGRKRFAIAQRPADGVIHA